MIFKNKVMIVIDGGTTRQMIYLNDFDRSFKA